MPLPLIPIVIGAVAAAGGLVTAKLIKPKTDEVLKVAILGGERTGKTTLRAAMRQADPAVTTYDPATGVFETTMAGGTVKIEIAHDVAGATQAKVTEWKAAFASAEAVLYLFRADLIHTQDDHHIQSVKLDLDMLKEWQDGAKSKAPRVILIGTWADRHPQFNIDADSFAKRVRTADPIKLGRSKFTKKAPVYVGSLSDEGAVTLVEDIMSGLVPTHSSKRKSK